MNWLPVVPITVVAAIVLFLIKEAVEYLRRKRSDGRKRLAIKTLLAQECERNHWTLKSLRRCLDSIEDKTETRSYELARDANQSPLFRVIDGGGSASWPIPRVYRDAADKFIMDSALLDKSIFSKLLPTFDAVAELEHVRNSLMHQLQSQEDEVGDIVSFAQYARETLDDVYSSLNELYSECTEETLKKFRLR
jgi:hypothetical protein